LNTFGKLLVKLGATPPPDSEFWYGPVAPLSGSYLSQFAGDSGALRINAVNACVRLRSETIGSLPCQVYRREADGRTVDRQHPLYRILHDAPNDSMSAFEFWQIAEQNLCTDGNFYAQILTDARNNVAELIPIDPEKMNVQRDDETGIIVFVETTGAAPKTYAEGDILHIPGMGYDGRERLKGMSPVAYMRQSLELSADAESYGARYFRNNAAPPAYIAHPNTLSDKAKEGILEYFMKHFGGVRNAGKLGILEEGMQLKTVPINHTDMQYLELRKFQVEEIARMYRVPLHMIGELSRSTNNNIEHQGLEWATNTIRPECTRIERRINMQLFGPRESAVFYAEFNLDALMRGDSAGRAAYYSALRNIGAINANEIRGRENMNPYDGGEVYMVQGAMIPVAMAGQTQQKAVAQ
jgi:HK97 family phage portal protein